MKMIGRVYEQQILNEHYRSKKSQLAVVYGRRRVGKSFLLTSWAKSQEAQFLFIEGLEGQNKLQQIENFKTKLVAKTNLTSFLDVKVKHWAPIFDLLTQYLKGHKNKTIILLDEFQWLAGEKTEFIALLKMYWDQEWSNLNVMFILCGSIASFMVNKVIGSKALYGRISLELKIRPFQLRDSYLLVSPNRSQFEILKYYFIFGGIPKYFKEINPKLSFEKNINKLCFTETGIMVNEFEKIFYQQFKSAKIYIQIIRLLEKGACTFKEVSENINFSSGGSLKRYLDNLIIADFISTYHPFQKTTASKEKKYFLCDEFCRFYIRFIEKNATVISRNTNVYLFEKLTNKNWNVWLGLSFELMCFKQAMVLADRCHFNEDVKNIGKFYPDKKYPVQLDLVFSRYSDIITVFEIKYTNQIDTDLVKEFEKKLSLIYDHPNFKNKTIEKGLVYIGDLTNSVKKLEYFHHLVHYTDLF